MRVLVAVPALNEAETVSQVVKEIRSAVNADVLVVDDASDDDTAERAQQAGAWVLRMPFNVGVGGAMRAAFCFAERHDYDAVVQVDADGQHEPSGIPALLSALEQGGAVVVGSRFEQGFPTSRARRFAMTILAWGVRRTTGFHITDTTSGFRAADRRAIAVFARRYPAEYLGDTTESLVVAAKAGLPVMEVSVAMRPRQGGLASHRKGRSALYLGRVLIALTVAGLTGRSTGAK